MSSVEPMQVDAVQEDNENRDIPDNFNVDGAPLDLETYVHSYVGLGRLNRLIFIADHCTELRLEALKLALQYVLKTHNIAMYQLIHRKILEAFGSAPQPQQAASSSSSTSSAPAAPSDAPPDVAVPGAPASPEAWDHEAAPAAAARAEASSENSQSGPNLPANFSNLGGSQTERAPPIAPFDQQWVDSRSKAATIKLEKLDTDLKNYKSNSIKESIRRGHDELGNHYLDCGDLSNALKCYSRARDYCVNGKQIINMCVNVVTVSVYLQNWSHVQSYATKATMTVEYSENSKQAQAMKVSLGLAAMANKKYEDAAEYFLQANLDLSDFPEIMSQSDVAIMGGLCALATLDRKELRRRALTSSSFKLFLELEPSLRDAMHKFYASDYASCLRTLQSMEKSWLLDMFLSPHVAPLLRLIRQRAQVQYFRPFISADLAKMSSAFDVSVGELEQELATLISEGKIKAKIDSHRKILLAQKPDVRPETFKQAAHLAMEFVWRTRGLMLRAAMIRADVCLKQYATTGAVGSREEVGSTNSASMGGLMGGASNSCGGVGVQFMTPQAAAAVAAAAIAPSLMNVAPPNSQGNSTP